MAGGDGGTAATEKLIRSAQKSTNQLKALLSVAEGGRVVEAILSDISDSLSQALASLQLGKSSSSDDRRLPAPTSLSAYGQSVENGGGRPVSRRRCQRRSRADGLSRRLLIQQGDRDDSYPWRKYGQKEILGARFARSYYRCAQTSGCTARKHVQKSDDDPSRLEITYIGEHTCDDDLPSPAIISPFSCHHRLPPAAVDVPPSTLQKLEEHLQAASDLMMPCTRSMETMEEMVASWLFIPSPACSQSELLPELEAEFHYQLQPDASLADPVEYKKGHGEEEFLPTDDFVVPDLM
uniref:WRKY domain-containing protein n=1 Tax=Leersia perrieri TaxID=77586 RepID=A0A0D9WYJ9_9ORYZ